MSERWPQVRRLFEEARELPPAERRRFLDETTGASPGLRRAVEELLRADAEAGDFLREPAVARAFPEAVVDPDASELPAGTLIGRYRIVRPLARGGVGVVYLAERSDATFEKLVALKVIKRGMDTVSVVARFRAERRILAALEHPSIARLIDAGTTKDGLPYFVMEYVDGVSFIEHCTARELELGDRLELFRKICTAVAYAHRNLVIHRDLKPSNILVGADGEPKLLDFGLAKILFPGPSEDTGQATATGERMLTPAYASPEQVRGEHVTTTTDVYSLGVILYELACGVQPYPAATSSPAELARQVCVEEPVRPRVLARIPRDLESIILKAMRKEPAHRYQTVDQLSDDVRRHLVGLPVSARRGTMAYRAGSFIRRHRFGVAAASLIVLSLLAGIVTTTWQARIASRERARAEQRYHDLRRLASSLLVEFDDAIADMPGAPPVREILVRRALDYLTALERESEGDVSLQREVAQAFLRMGDVQERSFGLTGGDIAGSLASYERARRICEALVEAHPAGVEDRDALAAVHGRTAVILWEMGDWGGHLEHARKAVEIRRRLLAERPGSHDLERGLAESLQTLGNAQLQAADAAGTLATFRDLVALRERLLAGGEGADTTSELAAALRNLAVAQELGGDLEAARVTRERALGLELALVEQYPGSVGHRSDLARTYRQLGSGMCRSGAPGQGLEYLRAAVALGEQLQRIDPNNALIRRRVVRAYRDLGEALLEHGGREEAGERLRRAATLLEPWARSNPVNVQVRVLLAQVTELLGRAAEGEGAVRRALRHYGRSLELWTELERDGRLAPRYGDQPARLAAAVARLGGGAAGERRAAPAGRTSGR